MHSTLSSIRHKLTAVRSAVRALYVVDGIFKVLVALILLLTAGFLLDRLIEFPRPMRLAMLLAQLGALALFAARYLIYPLRVPISVEDIAGQVELRNPFLKDRLISALQLERLLRDPEYADSRPLTEAVIREAEELAGGIRFFKILHPRPVVITGLIALLVCATASSAAAVWSQQAKIWALRNILLADIDWPRENQIHLVRRTFRVAPNKPLRVRFLFDALPETDTPIELRVLERVERPASEPAKNKKKPGSMKSSAPKRVEIDRALRFLGESEAVEAEMAENPRTLYYREWSVPLEQRKVEGGVALEATLEAGDRPRLFFLRADRVHNTPVFSLSFERVLSPFYQLQPVRRAEAHDLLVVPMPDTAIYVPMGHNLKLEAIVFGPVLRDSTTIEYTVVGEKPASDLLVGAEQSNRFSYEDFLEVRKEIKFTLTTGDSPPGRAREYRVKVRVPPSVAAHHIDLRFPSYLGRAAEPEMATKRDFLEMPLGTVFNVKVTGDFSKSQPDKGKQTPAVPYAAWLRFSQGRRTEIALKQEGGAVEDPKKPGRVRVTFSGTFVATQDTGFFFRLRGPNRLFNEGASHFQVSVRPDMPPVMSLERPKASGMAQYMATRNAAIRMVLRAKDDRGLGRVLLRYRLDGEKDYKELALKKAGYPFKVDYPAGKAPADEPTDETFSFLWELEKLGELKVGRTIHYHFMAEDYAPFQLGEKGELIRRGHGNRTYLRSGYSEQKFHADRSDYQIRVVSKLEMEQELNARLMVLRREVQRAAKRQRDIRKTTDGYARNKQYSATDLDQLFRLELQQNDLTRFTEDQVRAPLIEIRDLYSENQINPGSKVGRMVQLSSAIVKTASPAAAEQLKKAQANNDPAVQRESLTGAVSKQDEILKQFDEMLQEMQKWEDLSEVIQQAQELLKYQKEINALTKTLKQR